MKNKLKLILWGKNLQLPMNYDKLKFDDYTLEDDTLNLFKNNKIYKTIWYYNKQILYEYNYAIDMYSYEINHGDVKWKI